ncbi:MAG: hypothetical protein ACO3TG_03900 [Minisyncoccia bacterium]
MSKIIYILQDINKLDDWGVFKTLQEAEDAMHTNIVFEMPKNREARAKELIIITKII